MAKKREREGEQKSRKKKESQSKQTTGYFVFTKNETNNPCVHKLFRITTNLSWKHFAFMFFLFF